MEKMFWSLSLPGKATLQSTTGWRPLLDLCETPKEFIILVDLAGTQPKDVQVVDRDVVRFSGNRSRPPEIVVSKGLVKDAVQGDPRD